MSQLSRFVYGGGQDVDLCIRCDKPAIMGDPRLEVDVCSKECADAEIEERAREAERERLAEITSGGQV